MRPASIWIKVFAVLISLSLLCCSTVSGELNYFDLLNLTEREDGYYTMRDRANGTVLLLTARILHVGNEFLDRDNRHYRVVEIEEDTAWAELIENASRSDQSGLPGRFGWPAIPVQEQEEDGEDDEDEREEPGRPGRRPKVGIYHSHGAESYVPSDGAESIDQGGGILQVGDVFAESLERQGVETSHSKETHVPHDAGAYHRSRRTAEEKLVEEEADMIIDVHRDAVPPEAYEEVVEGEKVTQILLVVGQQNQTSGNNWQMAEDLKQIADEQYPGLIKGILAAEGNFNQDLSPRSILIEVGAHENSREDAEKAVEMFADVVNVYLTGTEAAPGQAARSTRIALSSLLILLAVLVAALFAYLYIAAGSWEEFKRKLSSFFNREFADLRRGIGKIGGRREDDDRDRG